MVTTTTQVRMTRGNFLTPHNRNLWDGKISLYSALTKDLDKE